MARIHADPVSTSLMHPTRRALYVALLEADEYTTVQLQEIVGVDRYNLYHHLRKLESLGLVMNHRTKAELAGGVLLTEYHFQAMVVLPLARPSSALLTYQPRVQAVKKYAQRIGTYTDIDLELATLQNLEIIGRRNWFVTSLKNDNCKWARRTKKPNWNRIQNLLPTYLV